MSVQTTVAPPSGSRFLRVWFPFVVLAVAGLAVLAIWFLPSERIPEERRNWYTTVAVFVTVVALLAWVLVSSGWPWQWRVGLLLGLAVILVASLRQFPTFTGNMRPVFIFRWMTLHDDVVEAHRQQQAGGATVVGFTPEASPPYAEYRGPRRDGVIVGPPLNSDWATRPPRELWRQPVGGGYAGFVVNDTLAITIEQRRGEEVVVAYDIDTGRERWKQSYSAHFQETMGGPGPRTTPTLAGDKVYALGATGVLICLDAASGTQRWQVNTLEGNANIHWGMSGSPLVYDNVVVVNPGSQTPASSGRAVLAFDRTTGKQVWAAGSQRGGYGSPMLATLAGRRQILIFDAAGLGGHDPQTGQELWRHPWVTYQEINVAQPVVLDGDRVFISSGYGHGCAMLQIKESEGQWSATELWQNRSMHCKFTSPVAHQGHLYGLDEGILVCLDAASGKRLWKEGRYQHGQLLLSGEKLVIFSEDGKLALVEANPAAYRELASMPVFDEKKNWNHLALAKGRVYLRNHREMACYDLAAPR